MFPGFFLSAVLSKFGFHSTFVDLILNNLRGAWFSVLINGSPHGFFKASRGIKQGDPLSPYLFLFLLESFSRRINRMAQEGLIAPYAMPRGYKLLTHLAFADDLILFICDSRISLRRLFAFLSDYEPVLGQKVSKEKSVFLVSKHYSRPHLRSLFLFTSLRSTAFPLKYLDCMIFKGRSEVVHFQHLIQKVENRLSGWHSKLLSMAGRFLLIRYVLTSIPMHVFAALDPPKTIIYVIQKESKVVSISLSMLCSTFRESLTVKALRP